MDVKQQHMRNYIITWEMSGSSCGLFKCHFSTVWWVGGKPWETSSKHWSTGL